MSGNRRTPMHWTKHCTTNIHPSVVMAGPSSTQSKTFETPKLKLVEALVPTKNNIGNDLSRRFASSVPTLAQSTQNLGEFT